MTIRYIGDTSAGSVQSWIFFKFWVGYRVEFAENWLEKTVRYCSRAYIPLGVYQTIVLRSLQCRGLQTMAGVEEDVQRRHSTEHSRKTWREPTYHGKRLNTLRWIVLSDDKLLPNVPTGTGGTWSKFKYRVGRYGSVPSGRKSWPVSNTVTAGYFGQHNPRISHWSSVLRLQRVRSNYGHAGKPPTTPSYIAIPAFNAQSRADELEHVALLAHVNNLKLIWLHLLKSSSPIADVSSRYAIPPELADIRRATSTRVLGVTLTIICQSATTSVTSSAGSRSPRTHSESSDVM